MHVRISPSESAGIYANRALGADSLLKTAFIARVAAAVYIYTLILDRLQRVCTPLTCHLSEKCRIDNYAHGHWRYGVHLDLVVSNYTGFYHRDEPIHDEGDNDQFTFCDVNIEG